MKMLFLDKKERLRAWFNPARVAALVASLLLVLFLPVWPDFVQSQFVLYPVTTALLRSTVPGTVAEVLVREGDKVAPGQMLVRMRNLDLESKSALAQQKLSEATAQAAKAELHYANFGVAEQERLEQVKNSELASEEAAQLSITSPASGVVLTARTEDLVGRSVDEGDLLLQVADVAEMKADVYVPEYAMHQVRIGQEVRLLTEGQLRPISGTLSLISPVPVPIAEGLLSKEQLQGVNPPRYFLGTVWLKNDGELRPGGAGTAKLLTGRLSLAGFGFRFGRQLIDRKIW